MGLVRVTSNATRSDVPTAMPREPSVLAVSSVQGISTTVEPPLLRAASAILRMALATTISPFTEWMSDADIDHVVTVAESLRWVLRLLLLDQAGLDREQIAASFRDSQHYRFFLRDAADWQPKIYADTPGSAQHIPGSASTGHWFRLANGSAAVLRRRTSWTKSQPTPARSKSEHRPTATRYDRVRGAHESTQSQ
jgi:hypothetical protein